MSATLLVQPVDLIVVSPGAVQHTVIGEDKLTVLFFDEFLIESAYYRSVSEY